MVGQGDEGRLVAGRYRLVERIGRGGMGTVWKAEDELLGRQVAVKKLHPPQPHLSEEELATLFERTRREARAAARISHPNVVVVHDVVDDAGLPSIVMEYVPSQTLGEQLKQDGALPVAEVARIGRGMVAALRAAHRAGVLHRDVKPGNVLLGLGGSAADGEAEGRVVLTDFGIAQASGTSTLTRTGELIGSIDFLSPERIRGALPGPESDLWALGATLYQAVEGESPFRRPTAIETAYSIAQDPVLPPPNGGVLSRVITGLLAKDPAERLSAEEAERLLRMPAAEPDTALVGEVRVPSSPRGGSHRRDETSAAAAAGRPAYSTSAPAPVSASTPAPVATPAPVSAPAPVSRHGESSGHVPSPAGQTGSYSGPAAAGAAQVETYPGPADTDTGQFGARHEQAATGAGQVATYPGQAAAGAGHAGTHHEQALPVLVRASVPAPVRATDSDFDSDPDSVLVPRQAGPPDPYQAEPPYPYPVRTPTDAPGPGRRRRVGRWIAGVAAVALVAAGGAFAGVHLRSGSGSGTPEESAPPVATGPTATATTPATAATATPSASPPPVPAGYHLYTEPSHHYSVPVPDGWTMQVDSGGDEVDFVFPAEKVDLKISALDFASTSPYDHFTNLEPATEANVDLYHRERLDPTVAFGDPAAIWEFTFQGSERKYHAIDLGFGEPGGTEYAVYVSAPDLQWDEYRAVFDIATAGFRQSAP